MTNQVIPGAAVEAAALASAGAFGEEPNKRDPAHVRLVLEAAAPHMLAEAWATCAVEAARCGLLSAADALILANRNPHTHALKLSRGSISEHGGEA